MLCAPRGEWFDSKTTSIIRKGSPVTVRIRRILVALRDVTKAPRAQLRKAATLALRAGASVELFHAIGEPAATGLIRRNAARRSLAESRQAIAERTGARLDKLARSPVFEGVKVTHHATWDYPAHEAIVRRVLATRADLVVAATQARSLGARLLLTNTDWELIRQCPCPVLLVKSPREYRKPVVLAAVDPFHAHAKPAKLDDRILDAGASLARLLSGELHVMHAYMPITAIAPGPVGQPLTLALPAEFEDVHTKQVASALDALAKAYDIPTRRRHLRMGEVSSEVVSVAKRTGAAIVVMGALSRSGLRRIFIGSTAESTLDVLPCDVLVVKPRGFTTPVAQRAPSF